MPQQDVIDAIKLAKQQMSAPVPTGSKTSPLGVQAFNSIQSNDQLSEQEKQEVFRTVAKDYVTNAMSNISGGQTLMRTDDAGTGFISAYMDNYAEEFNNAMRHTALQETAKTKIPQSLYNGATFGTGVGTITMPQGQTLSDKDKQDLNDSIVDLAKRLNQESVKNLSELSPEAREFMKAVLEPTANDPALRSQTAASILFLRSANAKINEDANMVKFSSGLGPDGAVMGYANIVNMSFNNSVGLPPGSLKGGKNQDVLASQLRDQSTLNLSRDAFEALAKGGDDLDDFFEQVGDPDDYSNANKNEQGRVGKYNVAVVKGHEEVQQKLLKGDVVRSETGIAANLDRVAKLQARLDRLESGKLKFGDKVSAFFAGGKDKYKTNTETQLKNAVQGIGDYIKQNENVNLDKIVGKLQERAKALDAVGDNLFSGGVEQYMNASKQQQKNMPFGKELMKQFEKNQAKLTEVNARAETIKSVRDTLGFGSKPKDAPTQEHDVSIGSSTSQSEGSSQGHSSSGSLKESDSDVGIRQLAGGKFDKPQPKVSTGEVLKKDHAQDGISKLAKGKFKVDDSSEDEAPKVNVPKHHTGFGN